MIGGRFGENGELFFDIELISANGEQLPVEVLIVNKPKDILTLKLANEGF